MTDQMPEESLPLSGEVISAVEQEKLKNLTLLVYLLQGLSLVVGLTAVAGVIINYLKRDEVRGTYLESHFNWQIKTFWWLLAGLVIGWLLAFVLIGFVVLFAVWVWYIYRIVKGWLALNDGRGIGNVLP